MADLEAPVYEIYLASPVIQSSTRKKGQAKFYYVNWNTLLLERVAYRDEDDARIYVETVVDGWQVVAGNNKIPKILRRLENGVEVLTLTIHSATLGPEGNDNAFRKN